MQGKLSRYHYRPFLFLFLLTASQISNNQVIAQMPPAPPQLNGLFQSIRNGDAAALSKELKAGASANDSAGGYSALMMAALQGTTEQMKILLENGAAVNYANKDSLTALWLAVPDRAKTALLLEHGANPQLLSKDHYNVLVKLATIPGTVDLFKMLIAKGADIKKSAPLHNNMLLYAAASSGDTAILDLLLKGGLAVNDTVFYGDYPINAALLFRTFPTLKMLVEHGANVNVQPRSGLVPLSGSTPLMFAALSNVPDAFYYLLDHGADPNLKNKRGYTALMMLQQNETDDPAMIKALIDHGADASITAPDGTNALSYALQKGNTKSVALLKKTLNK